MDREGQRRTGGLQSMGSQELDTTEQLTHTYTLIQKNYPYLQKLAELDKSPLKSKLSVLHFKRVTKLTVIMSHKGHLSTE